MIGCCLTTCLNLRKATIPMLDVGIGRYIKCLLDNGRYRASQVLMEYEEYPDETDANKDR